LSFDFVFLFLIIVPITDKASPKISPANGMRNIAPLLFTISVGPLFRRHRDMLLAVLLIQADAVDHDRIVDIHVRERLGGSVGVKHLLDFDSDVHALFSFPELIDILSFGK